MYAPAPRGTVAFFDLKDQPARTAERGNDKPQWDLGGPDAIPAAGAGETREAPGAGGIPGPANAHFPPPRTWIEKRDRAFRCSFASILD